MATVAAIVGHELPGNAAEDSVNILPTLLDPTEQVRQNLVNHSVRGEFAIREGNWKLIPSVGKMMQLYDLADDPAEKNNLSEKHPEIVERLSTKLKQYRQSGRSVSSVGDIPNGKIGENN